MVRLCDETGEFCPVQLLTVCLWVRVKAEGLPKLRWVDNVMKWSGSRVDEPEKVPIERKQVMAAS